MPRHSWRSRLSLLASSSCRVSAGENGFEVPCIEHAPFARGKIAERQAADARPMQVDDMIAKCGKHTPHLMVAALMQGQARMACAEHFQRGRQQRGLFRF